MQGRVHKFAAVAGAFGGRRELAETLVAATPLILGGLAFAVAARAGLFNIGIEGQMVVGGLCAGLAAAWDPVCRSSSISHWRSWRG